MLLKVAFLLSMYAQIFCAFITQLNLPHFIPASLAKRDWVRLYLFLCLISRNVYQLSSFALFVKMQWMGLHWYQESLIWFVLLLALIETRARNNPVILPLPRDEFSGLMANKNITYKLSLFGLIVTANPSHGMIMQDYYCFSLLMEVQLSLINSSLFFFAVCMPWVEEGIGRLLGL